MKKNGMLILILTLCFLSSCADYKKLYESNYDDIMGIDRIEIFVKDFCWCIKGDCDEATYYELVSEDDIRSSAIKIEIDSASNQIGRIMSLLYGAKKVNNLKDKTIIKKVNGIPFYYWTGGMIIDVYKNDGIESYIMKNGKKVFYKKGKENEFYKMPNQLLKKYFISENETKLGDNF